MGSCLNKREKKSWSHPFITINSPKWQPRKNVLGVFSLASVRKGLTLSINLEKKEKKEKTIHLCP